MSRARLAKARAFGISVMSATCWYSAWSRSIYPGSGGDLIGGISGILCWCDALVGAFSEIDSFIRSVCLINLYLRIGTISRWLPFDKSGGRAMPHYVYLEEAYQQAVARAIICNYYKWRWCDYKKWKYHRWKIYLFYSYGDTYLRRYAIESRWNNITEFNYSYRAKIEFRICWNIIRPCSGCASWSMQENWETWIIYTRTALISERFGQKKMHYGALHRTI